MVWEVTCERMESTAEIALKGKFTGWIIEDAQIWEQRKRNGDRTFYIVRERIVIGYLMARRLARKLYTPKMVQMDKSCKGKDYVYALYDWLVTSRRWTIKAGDVDNVQTIGGRYIWNELAKMPSVKVFAALNGTFEVCRPNDALRRVEAETINIYDTDAELFLTDAESVLY